MAGSPESFVAFRDLVSLLLNLTILAPQGGVTLASGPRTDVRVLGGWGGPEDPLPLNDGRFLRVSVTLLLAPTKDVLRLKVEESSYQYQMDTEGERWIFRYDYLRHPRHPYPASHLQIRGRLFEDCLPERTPLERIHFPDSRVPIEAVIRVLAEQFGVPCHQPPEIWRPVLAESERTFLGIAHRPLSGAGS
jgi:hypothetical protein